MHFHALKGIDGYVNGEASSAMHKAIRRGDEELALRMASTLDRSGNGNYVWKWLRHAPRPSHPSGHSPGVERWDDR